MILLGGFVTTCVLIFQLFYVFNRIAGGRAMAGAAGLAIFWLIFGVVPLALGRLILTTARSNKRYTRLTIVGVFLLFVVMGADGNYGPNNWRRVLDREQLPESDARLLRRTIVSPQLETEISPGTNILWCGTFELAWNEACRLAGGDLQYDRTNAMISALNRHEFTRQSLDDASFVAMAGFVKDGIHESLRAAVDEKFQGRFHPRFIPNQAMTPHPRDFVAYACLYKNLSFPSAFERLDDHLFFDGTKVAAFGMVARKTPLDYLTTQVLILDYHDENDFVIELKTNSDGDRLILAKLRPEITLGKTVAAVGQRMAIGAAQPATTNDVLVVPRVKIDLAREYSELEGLRLAPATNNMSKDLVLVSAVQSTLFQMNEKGVELRSEAHLSFACGAEAPPVLRHKMIFDQPFLILMQRRNAQTPYFAFWVDNSEALVSWK